MHIYMGIYVCAHMHAEKSASIIMKHRYSNIPFRPSRNIFILWTCVVIIQNRKAGPKFNIAMNSPLNTI